MEFTVGTHRTLAHMSAPARTRGTWPFRHARGSRRSFVLAAVVLWAFPAHAAKIACVGDSITYGYGLGSPSTESYPAQLAARLGSAHTVQNFGVSGATLLKNGDKPYWNEAAYGSSGNFDPDVVVIMLGTNDAKPQNWSKVAEFAPNYAELIQHYRALGALVYVATPPPVYSPGAFDIPPDVVAEEVVPRVRTVATDANAPLVDVFTALSGKAADFPDTVHPNAEGAGLIADAVKAALDEHGFGGASGAAGAGAGQGGRSSGGAGGVVGGAGTSGAPAGGVGGSGGTQGAAGTTGGSGNGGTTSRGGSAAGGDAQGGAGTSGGVPGVSGSAAVGGTTTSGGGAGTSGGVTGRAGTGGAAAGVPALGGSDTSGAGEPNGRPPAETDSGCGCHVEASTANARANACAALALAFVLVARRRRAR